MTASEPEFLVAALSELTEALYRDLDEAARITAGHFGEYGMTDAIYHPGQSHLAGATSGGCSNSARPGDGSSLLPCAQRPGVSEPPAASTAHAATGQEAGTEAGR